MMGLPKMVTHEAGHIIFREGETAEYMYFMTSGSASARFKGQEAEVIPGTVIGDAGLIDGVYWATVEAGPKGCT